MRSDLHLGAGRALTALVVALAALALACRQDMHDKGRIKPYSESRFFADGQAMRPIPAGTVARGQLREDVAFYTGIDANGEFVANVPVPLDRPLLERGRQQFDAFCSPCHGRVGAGGGIIVQRGFKAAASFHEQRLRDTPSGYFYDVISNGFGQMPSYSAQIEPADRWAIVAYVRALQLSQGAPSASLNAADREALSDSGQLALAPPASSATLGGH